MFRLFVLGLCCLSAWGADRVAVMQEVGEKKVLFLFENGKLQETPIPSSAEWSLYPALNAEGTELAFVATEAVKTGRPNSKIWVRNLNQGTTEQWTSGKDFSIHPNFSRNGRFLAYSFPFGEMGEHHIAVVDLQEARAQKAEFEEGVYRYDRLVKPRILPSEHSAYFPTLSQDGDFLAFQRNRDGLREIVLRDLKTDAMEVISPIGVESRSPAFSPDDRYVAFASQIANNWDIYLYDTERKQRQRLTFDAAEDFKPAFRADGTLLFASNRRGTFEIFDLNYLQKGPVGELPVIGNPTEANDPISYYAPTASGELALKRNVLCEMPQPARSSFGAVRVGNQIYVAGGHQGHEHTYPPESFLSRFETYDLATCRWRRLRDRPIAAHGYGLASYGKFIYAVGGFQYSKEHNPKWKSSDLIHRYNLRRNRWQTVGRLPRRRSSHGVAQIGPIAYLIGGWDATPRFEKDYDGTFHREIDAIDLRTGEVLPNVAQLPDPLRRAISVAVEDHTLYILGGISLGGSHFDLIDEVLTFDTQSKEWGKLPKLLFPTFAPAAGVMNGQLWMFGGMRKFGDQDYRYLDGIFRLDPKSGWIHVGRFLQEKKGFSQVVSLDARSLLVLGGHSYDHGDAPTRTLEWLRWEP